MSISPAAVLAGYLVSKSHGSLGTTLFVGKEVGTGDTVTVYDTGGSAPTMPLNANCNINFLPSVQVRVRNGSYVSAWNKAEAIRNDVLKIANYSKGGAEIMSARLIMDVVSIGENQNNQSILTVNFSLMMR